MERLWRGSITERASGLPLTAGWPLTETHNIYKKRSGNSESTCSRGWRSCSSHPVLLLQRPHREPLHSFSLLSPRNQRGKNTKGKTVGVQYLRKVVFNPPATLKPEDGKENRTGRRAPCKLSSCFQINTSAGRSDAPGSQQLRFLFPSTVSTCAFIFKIQHESVLRKSHAATCIFYLADRERSAVVGNTRLPHFVYVL